MSTELTTGGALPISPLCQGPARQGPARQSPPQ